MKCDGGWKGTKLEFGNKLVYELVHNSLDMDGAITRSLNAERGNENLHHS